MKQINGNKIYDTASILSMDVDQRKLYNSSGTQVFSWASGVPGIATTRYVYLLQDAADITALGGSTSNVYGTFSTAYAAANTLQLALGGTSRVVIRVGAITAAVSGNITLVADWNANVSIEGINQELSILGNITLSNASGSGWNIGTNLSTGLVIFSDVKIGNIITDATGTSGTAGSVYLHLISCRIGNISASLTNASNSTGSSGAINITNPAGTILANVSNRIVNASSAGATGELTLGGAFPLYLTAIGNSVTNNPGATQGAIRLANLYLDGSVHLATLGGLIFINDITIAAGKAITLGFGATLNSDLDIVIKNVTTNQYPASSESSTNIVRPDISITVGDNHTFGNCTVEMWNVDGGTLELENVSTVRIKHSAWRSDVASPITLIDTGAVTFYHCVLEQIDGSVQCVDIQDPAGDFDLTFLHTDIFGGTKSLQSNVGATNVKVGSTYMENGRTNITLVPLTMDA